MAYISAIAGRARWRRALATLALVAFGAAPAGADSLYDDAFAVRIANFSDPQALADFSDQAVRVGQYDQAISTLEQILFQNPDDIGARLTLARLYYHIGSFDLALGHVNEALRLNVPTFELALRELQARIERAQRPLRARVDVTAGGQIVHARTAYPSGFATGTTTTGGGGFGAIDAEIVNDLQTATRDLIRFEGGVSVDQGFFDTDFDGRYDGFTALGGYGAVTLSKGLPDIIDTLRADIGVFGEYRDLGGPRDLRKLGLRGRLGFRPAVETAVYVEGAYGWLDQSQALFATDRWSYGAGLRQRLVPGWTFDAHVRRTHRRGTVPGAALAGTDFAYQVAGTEAGASLTHLLYVFEDGRGWFHQFGVRYTDETILDYGAVGVARGPFVKDRDAWHIDWDHTVQLSAQGWLRFGVGYRNERVGPSGFNGRTEAWTGRLRYTHRFE